MCCHVILLQDYIEEFRDISKGKLKESIPAGTITLINQRSVGEDLHVNVSVYLFLFLVYLYQKECYY